MKIPDLPTDNLYKFIALLGMTIFILSLIFPIWKMQEIAERNFILEEELSLYQRRMKDAKLKAASLWSFVEQHPPDKSPPNKAQLDRFVSQVDLMEKELKDIGDWQSKAIIRVEFLKYLKQQLERWEVYLTIGVCIGSAIMLCGFIMWYFKLQRYQDRIIKKEAGKNN